MQWMMACDSYFNADKSDLTESNYYYGVRSELGSKLGYLIKEVSRQLDNG